MMRRPAPKTGNRNERPASLPAYTDAALANLDTALENLAAAARDETEDWDYRLLTANVLLDFPRPQYRELLEALEKRQKKFGKKYKKCCLSDNAAG